MIERIRITDYFIEHLADDRTTNQYRLITHAYKRRDRLYVEAEQDLWSKEQATNFVILCWRLNVKPIVSTGQE